MTMRILWLGLAAAGVLAAQAARPSALDLAGKWEGAVTFGKFSFTLVLHVVTNAAGRVEATLDVPEQGQRGIRTDALLFNPPDFRLEIDAFGTAYRGKVNESLSEITGEFEEGPGGRPEPLVFKRSLQPDTPEPQAVYTFAPGEARDARGYWKGEVDAGPDTQMAAALNIGRLPDGSFRAALDLPEVGAKDIPASSVTTADGSTVIEWKAMQSALHLKLSEDAARLSGVRIQGGRTNPVVFQRLSGPYQLVPAEVSFQADPGKADDIRGAWKGTLETPQGKLRLVIKVGRSPDGSYAGTLSSVDQGGREMPANSASYEAPALKMEWRAIRGKYEGKLSADGKLIAGNWEQFGNGMPLKLERVPEGEASAR